MTGHVSTAVVRPAVPQDAVAVTALDASCFGPSAWSASSWTDEFARLSGKADGDRHILVAIRRADDPQADVGSVGGSVGGRGAERVVGYVVLIVPADRRDPVDLTRIAVAPGARRTGVGERLLASALEAVAGRTVLLEVAEGNEAAIGLYLRAGFGEISRRRGYYGADGDALILRRVADSGVAGDGTGGR